MWSDGCDRCPKWANRAPIAPTSFLCASFQAVYHTRSLYPWVLSKLLNIFNQQFANKKSWTFATLPCVGAVFVGPGRGSSKTDVQRRGNPIIALLTVSIKWEKSLYTIYNRCLILLRDSLPKIKIESATDIANFQYFWNLQTRPLTHESRTKLQV